MRRTGYVHTKNTWMGTVPTYLRRAYLIAVRSSDYIHKTVFFQKACPKEISLLAKKKTLVFAIWSNQSA